MPTYGPVPVCPENNFAASELALGNPYAYNPTKAKRSSSRTAGR